MPPCPVVTAMKGSGSVHGKGEVGGDSCKSSSIPWLALRHFYGDVITDSIGMDVPTFHLGAV